ncbi:hypothetical protein [Streptomyces sp. NPDC096033]
MRGYDLDSDHDLALADGSAPVIFHGLRYQPVLRLYLTPLGPPTTPP